MSGENCVFCSENQDIEHHHIVPRKYGGENTDKNLLTVCERCHKILERTYDARFYDKIGARSGMTPNMMMDHIRELEDLLYNALVSVSYAEHIYEGWLEHVEAQDTLEGSHVPKHIEYRIRLETIQHLRDEEGMVCWNKFPSWDDYNEVRRYREWYEEES